MTDAIVQTTASSPSGESHVATGTRRALRARTPGPAHPPASEGDNNPVNSIVAMRNTRMMHLLERIAAKFNKAGIPLMALKGAALNLLIYKRRADRPMDDLDLLVRPEDHDTAFALLEELGGLRGEPLVREDFFPRFHYEIEYTVGSIYPVKVDLHIRPFRPLRYAALLPKSALWERADRVQIGAATVLVPSAEEMLIHLAAHSAVHGHCRTTWLVDIRRWVEARRDRIDWDRFLETVAAWRLVLPVRQAIARVEQEIGPVCPPVISSRLAGMPVTWRDRLVLRQAPRDHDHPTVHVLVNALCTPGWRFVLAYLRAVILPDRGHMEEWYCHRHRGWLVCAHLLRCLGPMTRLVRPVWTWFSKLEIRKSPIHGIGVFSTRHIKTGEVIARYRGRAVDRDGTYVGWCKTTDGHTQRYELTGRLKYLNHSCRPNAELSEFKLVAIRPIRAGKEITINYGDETCECDRHANRANDVSTHGMIARVA